MVIELVPSVEETKLVCIRVCCRGDIGLSASLATNHTVSLEECNDDGATIRVLCRFVCSGAAVNRKNRVRVTAA